MLDLGLYFIVEPGNIHIRIANWADEGVVSGTPINEDYSTYMIGTKRSMENQLLFLEKYAQYPDVVRFHLSFLCLKQIGIFFWLGWTILLKSMNMKKRPNHYWTVYVTMPLVSSRLFRVIHHQQR